MKKLLMILLLASSCLLGQHMNSYGADGTATKPYLIWNEEDFDSLHDYTRFPLGGRKYFALMSDLDFSGYGNWEPIGWLIDDYWENQLIGNGHKISNITITQYNKDQNYCNIGIWAGGQAINTVESVIKNVIFENITASLLDSVATSSYNVTIGCIAGRSTTGNSSFLLENCDLINLNLNLYVQDGYYLYCGLVCGQYADLYNTLIDGSLNATLLDPFRYAYIGGCIGRTNDNNSFRKIGINSDVAVIGGGSTAYVGGMVGWSYSDKVRDCYIKGNIKTTDARYVGGCFGSLYFLPEYKNIYVNIDTFDIGRTSAYAQYYGQFFGTASVDLSGASYDDIYYCTENALGDTISTSSHVGEIDSTEFHTRTKDELTVKDSFYNFLWSNDSDPYNWSYDWDIVETVNDGNPYLIAPEASGFYSSLDNLIDDFENNSKNKWTQISGAPLITKTDILYQSSPYQYEIDFYALQGTYMLYTKGDCKLRYNELFKIDSGFVYKLTYKLRIVDELQSFTNIYLISDSTYNPSNNLAGYIPADWQSYEQDTTISVTITFTAQESTDSCYVYIISEDPSAGYDRFYIDEIAFGLYDTPVFNTVDNITILLDSSNNTYTIPLEWTSTINNPPSIVRWEWSNLSAYTPSGMFVNGSAAGVTVDDSTKSYNLVIDALEDSVREQIYQGNGILRIWCSGFENYYKDIYVNLISGTSSYIIINSTETIEDSVNINYTTYGVDSLELQYYTGDWYTIDSTGTKTPSSGIETFTRKYLKPSYPLIKAKQIETLPIWNNYYNIGVLNSTTICSYDYYYNDYKYGEIYRPFYHKQFWNVGCGWATGCEVGMSWILLEVNDDEVTDRYDITYKKYTTEWETYWEGDRDPIFAPEKVDSIQINDNGVFSRWNIYDHLNSSLGFVSTILDSIDYGGYRWRMEDYNLLVKNLVTGNSGIVYSFDPPIDTEWYSGHDWRPEFTMGIAQAGINEIIEQYNLPDTLDLPINYNDLRLYHTKPILIINSLYRGKGLSRSNYIDEYAPVYMAESVFNLTLEAPKLRAIYFRPWETVPLEH